MVQASHALNAAATARSIARYAVLTCVFAATLWFAWTGFTASDDGTYINTGRGWLTQFPFVPKDFGSARAYAGIPIGLSLAFFGDSEFSVVLPTCLFMYATLLLTQHGLGCRIGPQRALLVVMVMATVPLFALKASIVNVDIPELFFSACSVWLLADAMQGHRHVAGLLGCGVMAAFAFSVHESAALLMLFYGLLFVLGFRMPRGCYLVIAGGFATGMLIEFVYYAWVTGNPLYRYSLSLQGTQVSDRIGMPAFGLDDSGAIRIAAGLDPLLLLFTKKDFGLVFYLAVPAALWSLWGWRGWRREQMDQRDLALLLLALAIFWCVGTAVGLQQMKLLPRYYIVPTYLLCLAIGLWMNSLYGEGRRSMVFGLMAAALGINLAAIALDNKDPLFGERMLVTYLAQSTGAVGTDPYTASRAIWLIRWAGQDNDRIRREPPDVATTFYFHNPTNAARTNRLVRTQEEVARYVPDAAWQPVWRYRESGRPIAAIMKLARLDHLLSSEVFEKIAGLQREVVVYRIDKVPSLAR